MTKTIFRFGSIITVALSTYLLAATCAPRPALAQAPPTATVEKEHPRRTVSVTISPLLLILPIFQVAGEARLLDQLGVSLIAGGGKVKARSELGTELSVPIWEVGLSPRYYVVGDFRHGMQAGAQLLYIHASTESQGVSAVASGFSVGGFLGYKVMADAGFTFEGQLGYQVIGVGAHASDGQMMVSRSGSAHGPLLNLNVGWSF